MLMNVVISCMSTEMDHVKPSLVHDLFCIQSIGMIPLIQFKLIILEEQYKKYEQKTRKVWYPGLDKRCFLQLHVQGMKPYIQKQLQAFVGPTSSIVNLCS